LLNNGPYYMQKSHGSELIVFDDYLVLSSVSTGGYFGIDDDETVSVLLINNSDFNLSSL